MLEICTSFVLGIIASLIAWYVLQHHVIPKVEFFPEIYRAETDETPCGFKYRVRFRNTGRREILDFEIFAKLRVRGLNHSRLRSWRVIYIPVDDRRIPRVPSHRGTAKRLAVQLLVSEVPAHAVAAFPVEMRTAYGDGQPTLEKIMGLGEEATLQMIGFGYDAFSGARKVVQSKIYHIDDIVEDEQRCR